MQFILYVVFAALVVALDQVTKALVVANIPLWGHVDFLPGFLDFTYVQNTGAAFGIMQGGNLILIVITLRIVGYLLKSWKELCAYGPWVQWGLVLILGGALGNLYDRITLGFVVDFLDFRVWPVFNVADSFITVGGCLLALSLVGQMLKKQEEK